MDSFPNLLQNFLNGDDEEYELELVANVVIEDEQQRRTRRRRGGSVPGHRVIFRDRVSAHERLYHDYFAEDCVYTPDQFRRRFRMSRTLFCRILNAVEEYDPYFVQRTDAVGVLGLSSLQKVTAAFRMLAYGAPADAVDEYVKIGESTALQSLRHFVKAIVVVFGDEYGRSPNNNDIARLLADGESRGFPGMLGSIDCMHWEWKNCPTAWQGQYTGHYQKPSLILEAVASHDLWIWHYFFGGPGSLNDINVLDRSPIFTNLCKGSAPAVNYSIDGHDYTMGYYLADGIYPTWATFVKTIPCPQSQMHKNFAKMQEGERKSVERAFGVLQARFAIVRGPGRLWDVETLTNIVQACIVMHNMIIEDEGDIDTTEFDSTEENPPVSVSHVRTREMETWLQSHNKIRERETHSQLQSDLVEHLWRRCGNNA